MTGDRRCVRACLGLALLAVIAAPVAAQVGGGALAGTVVDQVGAAVPGATVTVTAVATNRPRTTVTGEDGYYLFTGLRPGEYTLRTELSGFRTLTREGVRLATGEAVRVDLALSVSWARRCV